MFTAVLFVSAVSEAQGSITPLPVSGCTDGSYVLNPGSNAGLVSDCKALVAVRNHWTGRSDNAGLPGTHPLRTWGSGNSAVGSWAGVSVRGQRVIGVDLIVSRNAGASRISGALPAQLGDLSRLISLDLGNNNLTGEIPEELGDLAALAHLNLNGNKLRGSIPEELGDLSRLTVLKLGSNNLTGPIPEELGELTKLTYLNLDGNKLRGSIPEELGDLSRLTVLQLGNNNLTGEIPEELGDLTKLRHLNLDGNKLRGSIPEELGDLSRLIFLNLGSNNLTGEIPEELGELTVLAYLYLNGNKLRGSIPEELGDLSNLTVLDLGSNKLTGEMPEELGNLTKLVHLILSSNKLRGGIPEELGELTRLRSLYLHTNELRGEIPRELEDLTRLQTLSIGSNQLSGSVPEELGDLSPSKSGSLTGLYICRNMLSVTLPVDLRSVKGDASGCALAPGGLGATAGDGQVTLRWTDPGNASIRGYQYRVCEPGGLNCGAWARIPGSGAGTASYVADELENDEDYLFQLRAINGKGPGMSAEVGERPGLPEPPTVDAGSDQAVGEGEAVTLSGSVTGAEGRELTYLWEQTGGTPTVTLSGADTVTAGFTAPSQIISNAALVFRLTVSDGVNSVGDTVTITVKAGANDAPTADAGDDRTVEEGETVTLDGSGSSDPEGDALSYAWWKGDVFSYELEKSGPEVTLSSSRTKSPTFTAPKQLVEDADLVFSLVVTDARGLASKVDLVTITVTAGANDAPTADAGDDQTVDEGKTVTLDGSGSGDPEGETLTYAWTKKSGPAVTLSSSTAQSPTFTAPVQLASDAVFVFSLVVTDARGLSSTADTVTVTVKANNAPTADAGDDRTVAEGAAVTLDGSGSRDPEGETLTYAWTKKSGPAVTLSSSTAQSPTFTAPVQLASDAVFVFSLVVTDARGLASSADTVTVTVTAGPNDAPTADAGEDQKVDEGAAVTLDGSGSSDPEGTALTYAWTQTGGTTVTLSSSTAQSPTFTVPTQVANPTLVFSLVVTDARSLASSAEKVTVTVNNAPTADAGDDRTVVSGSSVTLNGSGSSDPDNDPLTYSWEQTSGTTVTLSNANAAKASFTAPSALGKYEFELTVSDRTRSATDSVVITVRAPIIIYRYNDDTFYRRGTSLPSAPTASTGTPSGWSTSNPGPTSTEGVYSVTRTQTLRNSVVVSASYGSVSKVSDPEPPEPPQRKLLKTQVSCGKWWYVVLPLHPPQRFYRRRCTEIKTYSLPPLVETRTYTEISRIILR